MRQRPGKFSFEVPHPMPVLYFTELLALAMDLPGVEKWLKSHIIDAVPLLGTTSFMKSV
jgi:heterodisulfide reductase subunit B